MSAVAELEDSLRAMLGLKPPGVSGTKINSITALCIANVQVRAFLKAMMPPVAVRETYLTNISMSRVVRITSYPEAVYSFQKGTRLAQTWSTLRRRQCNSQMAGPGQDPGAGNKQRRPRRYLRSWSS